jgi:putative nucleotidyltransferase with HDIG domain
VTDAVNSAMLELQGALLARSLYPEHHPRIQMCEQRAGQLLRDVLSRRPELTVFAVADRVVLDDQVLPASATLADSLFRRLRQNGVDRITFRRGLDESELKSFLDALAGVEPRGRRPLRASAHLGVGFIRQEEHQPEQPARAPEPDEVPLPRQLAHVLQGVWQCVEEGKGVSSDNLGDIVTSISKALSDSASALLPLASLKQHDEYTFVHTINVAILSTALSEAVGFTGRDTHALSQAALLHDVGKQMIPLELLNKQGRFTDEEFRLVQMHPVEGARMLLATPGIPEVAPIVAYEHHVRADGTGYPKLPRNWRLSMASRIVQVADVFDALRTHRPYRPALPLPEIVGVMQKDAGVFFDSDVLDVFFQRVVSRGLPEPAALAAP